MTDPLAVAVNRDGLYTLAVPSEFEAAGPFAVELRNHGEAAHVHLNLDEDLSTVGSLGESNHYVAPYSRRSVEIDTKRTDTPVTGRLKVVTSYGAESAYTTVTVSPPGTVTERVTVDERLAKPQRSEPEPSTLGERLAAIDADDISPRVAAGSMLAVCVILVAGALVQNTAAFVGSLAVIAGVVAALAITRRR